MIGATFNPVAHVGMPCFFEQWKMIIFKLKGLHWTIVYITERSSKMASTLPQKFLIIFWWKAKNFVYFRPYDFAQILPHVVQILNQIMYGETSQASNVSISNGNIIICTIGKFIFAVNLPLNLFLATVANADIGSVKFLHTLFDTYLYMLVKFEQNRIVKTTRNLSFFIKKNGGSTQPLRHFGSSFCSWYLMLISIGILFKELKKMTLKF